MQNYTLQGAIGQGQYGTAYKAQHKYDGQLYCIKRIPMSAKDDQKASLKEAQLLSSLDHPNIIGYKECFIDTDESLCIVTTFCEEGDLFNRIRKHATNNQYFTENEVMDMFIQVASALLYIHSKKVLHRDLKTQNIFIARGDIIKLGDFGISKVLEKTDQFATTVTGTPYYMAPEICTNQPYTFKSDIWSLGCVLYELCTLKHAFAADSLLSLVYQIVRGNFPPIPNDMFSSGLSNLVNALLVRDQNQRPSLQQIFQMPYVQQHVQRYHMEEKRRVLRTANTMTKKKAMMERTLQEAREAAPDPEYDKLTPKEKLARKKELERKKRELELQLATMNMQNDRKAAAERKTRMVHESKTGLPGGQTPRKSSNSAMWDVDVPSDTTAGRRGDVVGGGNTLDNSLVNMGTMPGGGPVDPFGRTRPSSSTAARMQGTGRPGSYNNYDERPVGGRTLQGAGDTVLMGSVGLPQMQTNAGRGGPSSGGGMWGGGNTIGANNSMVNYGTMNMGPGGMPTTPPIVPSNIVNGFKFGMTNAGGANRPGSMPAQDGRAQSPSPPRNNIRFGVRSPSKPRGSFDYAVQDAGGGGRAAAGQDEYEEDFDDEYESDFEDYSPGDDADMVNQRIKILNNVEELERSMGSLSFDNTGMDGVLPQERINTITKNSKAQVLRDRCQGMLGYHFGDVYTYLRRVRSSSEPVDEREVQKKLLELVGGNRDLLQGCFMTDQLVFQESMWGGK
mmetsp:Transcript_23560/g.51706  ORF Transcript_23560/g.51706 Transcript_23560/m.51706 type:complete len:731 (-) Transcript_23560:30-2222(-)